MKGQKILRGIKIWYALLFIIPLLFFINYCSSITSEHLQRVKDTTAPTITITSPQDGSPYSKIVVVEGVVRDTSGASGKGEIKSLSYSVLGTLIGETVPFNQDGSFSFYFTTTNLSGPIVVLVSATDWNDNKGEASLTLTDAGNDIPSFNVTPGDKKVTLTWKPVPFAESYTLYYTTNGTLPSEYYGYRVDEVTSPYILNGLDNGNMHVFLLKANSSKGEDNWSDYKKAIPLSQTTLAPLVTDMFRKIKLSWNEIPATNEFEVWRSTEENGTYINISGSYTGNSFEDTQVKENTFYYYKIKPTLTGSIESKPNPGKSEPIPKNKGAIIGSRGLSDNAGDVAVQGDYAFVATGYMGVAILNIADPYNPVHIASLETPGIAEAVSVKGNYAYVVDRVNGLFIFDISIPDSPVFKTSLDIGSAAYELTINENYAFVVGYYFTVIDITNPLSPSKIGSCSLNEAASDVTVSGNYAYVADGSKGLVIVNMTNITSPFIEGTCDTPGSANDVEVNGNLAYIADATKGLQIVDVSLKSSPVLRWELPGFYAQGIELRRNFAYVAAWGDGLYVIDISNPASPILRGCCNTPGAASGLKLKNNLAVIGDWNSGLKIIDISIPDNPVFVSQCSANAEITSILTRGNYAVLGENDYLQVISLTGEGAPKPVGELKLSQVPSPPQYIYDMEICGNLVYIISKSWYSFLSIVDISQPTQPVNIKSYMIDLSGSNYAASIKVSGDYAFVGCTNALKIIDISDPESPFTKGTCELPYGSASGINIYDKYAFIAHGSAGLLIVDISDLENPVIVNSCTTSNAYDVWVSDGYAFIADGSSGIKVINVSDPEDPGGLPTAASCDTTDARSIVVRGDYAYVADNAGGLVIIDLFSLYENKGVPIYILSSYSSVSTTRLAVDGKYAYIGAGSIFQIIDLLPDE